jgi:hypothetical protein
MYHHDNRNYNVALREAEEHLNKQIQIKAASAANVIERVLGTQLVDRVVPSTGIRFSFKTDTVKVATADGEIEQSKHTVLMSTKAHNAKNAFSEPMHKHALMQASARAGVPETFVNRMLEKPYGGSLVCDTLNTIYGKEAAENFLVRANDNQIRGVLSDTFRRMDSRPILEAFAETCKGLGAIPIEGIGGDLRFSVKALIPRVYVVGKKAGNEEVFAFGASLSNSDFGCGALCLQFFLWRIWCSNTSTREDSLRKVHLGKRLSEDITYSQETYDADTKAMSLAVRDHVKGVLAEPRVEEALVQIETAMDTVIDPKKFFERGGELERLKLSKGEIAAARETFNNGDITVLPRGTNVARMSQAVAWLAQTVSSAERRLELERVAGVIMERPVEAQAA